jgi:hypothetical protein
MLMEWRKSNLLQTNPSNIKDEREFVFYIYLLIDLL